VERLVGHPYYYVLNDNSSYNHVPLDADKHENTTLTSAFGAFAYCCMPFGSCSSPIMESLAEDCKLSTCGRQPLVTFSFLLLVDLVLLVLFLFLLCFSGHMSVILLCCTGLVPPIQYCIFGHIGDNVSF
jgi:hypothetical protein